MKSSMVFPVVPLLLLSALLSLAQGKMELCLHNVTMQGKCGLNDGDMNCALFMMSIYGASAMPQDCICHDKEHGGVCGSGSGSGRGGHVCQCLIVCGAASQIAPSPTFPLPATSPSLSPC